MEDLMTNNALQRLEGMKNKAFLFRNEEVVVLNYCEGTGEDGDEVEIYLNNGSTLCYNYCNLSSKLDKFKPITSTVVMLANKRMDSVSTINPSIIANLRDMVMNQIDAVRTNPNAAGQAKQVFNGVNTLINLAKTELEYRKYMNSVSDLE